MARIVGSDGPNLVTRYTVHVGWMDIPDGHISECLKLKGSYKEEKFVPIVLTVIAKHVSQETFSWGLINTEKKILTKVFMST